MGLHPATATSIAADGTAADRTCPHCAAALLAGQEGPYCCLGCQVVHHAIEGAGLTRYYDLRGHDGVPVGDLGRERPLGWLDPMIDGLRAAEATGDPVVLRLRMQGIRCAACVWLIEQLFARARGGLHCDVNPGSGALALTVRSDFDLLAFVRQVEGFGYLLGLAQHDPAADLARTRREGLLLRATLASVCAGNAMVFAAAIYFGLESGPLFHLLHGLNFACATLAVLLGGPVFVSSAVRALRAGLLHLDLPIAVGIVGSFLAATWSYISGHTEAAYYDSLAVFVALMLWGRYLQDRLVDWNRERLLSDQGIEGLSARRIEASGVTEVPIEAVRAEDRLALPVGEMLLVAAELDQDQASCALDSIDGEPEPRTFARGQRIPAGAVNVGQQTLKLVATETFAESAALPLLRTPNPAHAAAAEAHDRGASRFSALYVVAVLGFAGLGFWIAWGRGLDWGEAFAVATAVCVVTCPCSIGIALPLAREATYRRLQQLGLFVRAQGFFDRAPAIRQIAFDKTGTLTDGELHLARPERLEELAPTDRAVLLAMVSLSNHPRARAIERALRQRLQGPVLLPDLELSEIAGSGLETHLNGHNYRLGSAAFVGWGGDTESEHFAKDGLSLLSLQLTERLRPAAAQELDRLRRLGYQLFVLSGDASERVERTARELGLPWQQVHGRMTPADKRRWLEQHDAGHTLMLGDGINDSLALEVAACSGTPSISRTSVCARADFYYTSAGLAPVTAALLAARDLRRITRRNWAFLALYNTVAVTAAVMGMMEPLIAAVVMPLSSIASITATAVTLNRWSLAWKS